MQKILTFVVVTPLQVFAIVPMVLILLLWKSLVLLVVRLFKPDFGQAVSITGTTVTLRDGLDLEQNKISICCTLSLSGDALSLEQLRALFEEKVLGCRLAGGGKLRYPELKQHPVTFCGYQFWRADTSFRIEDHVTETVYPGEIPPQPELFEEVLNLTFPEGRSPWALTLLKGGGGGEEVKERRRCVLLLRMHHVMADARSMVKLVVEGLGGEELKTASIQRMPRRPLQKLLSWGLLPFHAINHLRTLGLIQQQSQSHPWWIPDFSKDKSPFLVGSSSKIPLEQLKLIGRKAGVDTSAVIMAIITGAVRRFFDRRRDRDGPPVVVVDDDDDDFEGGVAVGWTLPRANHPPTLSNHVHGGIPVLPINVKEEAERLRQCGARYRQARSTQHEDFLEIGTLLLSTAPTPLLRQFLKDGNDVPVPFGVTNIAGHLERLWIGGMECLDFNFCVNIPRSHMGVLFVVFSYKGSIQINVVAKSSILGNPDLRSLLELVELETADLYCKFNNAPSGVAKIPRAEEGRNIGSYV